MTDELPPLPEPKYIYHRSNTPGEDDLFEFAECGAVDTDSEGRICQGCERLYTASQVEEIRRAAILAERERFRAMFDEALADHGITWPGEVDILYEKMFPAAAIREGVK